MMDEPTPIVSLLAAKGGARPAVRSQFQPLRTGDSLARKAVEDADWAEFSSGQDADEAPFVQPVNDAGTNVRFIRREVALSLTPVASIAPAARTARPRRRAFDQNRKAAFTLRIDAERHAQLRLACTAANRSAQSVLTEALDRLISDIAGADSRLPRT
ncbi:MAG: hypothetical protein ABIQ66_01350 [Novosphingobium sp.]